MDPMRGNYFLFRKEYNCLESGLAGYTSIFGESQGLSLACLAGTFPHLT